MCGRYPLTRVDKLAERFGIKPKDDWVPRYNIAPTQNIPVIHLDLSCDLWTKAETAFGSMVGTRMCNRATVAP